LNGGASSLVRIFLVSFVLKGSPYKDPKFGLKSKEIVSNNQGFYQVERNTKKIA